MRSSPVFVFANILYRFFFPAYRIFYFGFKRKQDKYEMELLQRFIKPGHHVLDIGANIGFYSSYISKWVGVSGEVHSFEPDQTNFRHLKSITKNLRNVTINNMAVSDKKGELKLYQSNLLNVDHRTYAVSDHGKVYSVPADTIDNYVASKFKVDFIKMDIQGAEMFALRGMSNTLDENPQLKILTELWPFVLKDAGTSVEEIESFLKERGFIIYMIHNGKPEKTESLAPYKDKPEEEYFNMLLSRQPL